MPVYLCNVPEKTIQSWCFPNGHIYFTPVRRPSPLWSLRLLDSHPCPFLSPFNHSVSLSSLTSLPLVPAQSLSLPLGLGNILLHIFFLLVQIISLAWIAYFTLYTSLNIVEYYYCRLVAGIIIFIFSTFVIIATSLSS